MKILFIQTGGTIDKEYPIGPGAYAFEISEPAAKAILANINLHFDYEILCLLKKDSQDITQADRNNIFNTCMETEPDKIIITHGTDTMIETARHLCSIPNKTIVITGAEKPWAFQNSDAPFNLGGAVACAQSLSHGVFIYINGLILNAEEAQRDPVTGKFYRNA